MMAQRSWETAVTTEAAMKVKDAMHKGVDWVSADTPVTELAKLMCEHDIGPSAFKKTPIAKARTAAVTIATVFSPIITLP
jgi:predicted transcriptional regulator